MMLLTDLPPEIIHQVLGYVDPADLAWIQRISKAFYRTVAGNRSLFKLVYLQHFDDPLRGNQTKASDFNWEKALKDIVHVQVICRRASVQDKKREIDFVHDVVVDFLKAAAKSGPRRTVTATHPSTRNVALLSEIFSEPTNQSAFLCRSFIYVRARAEFVSGESLSRPPHELHQKSAHLHCLFGVPLLSAYPGGRRMETRRSGMGPFACSKVYDLRQYTHRTKWGPFMDDDSDRVDWEKVEAIMIVLGANLAKLGLDQYAICQLFWRIPFAGSWPGSYMPLPFLSLSSPSSLATRRDRINYSPKPKSFPGRRPSDSDNSDSEQPPIEERDPYGVTGTWLRVVCFLDYSDFSAYNFHADEPPPAEVPRPAIDYGEATRLILMRVFVTAIEPPGPDDGQDLPVVHFMGISSALDDGPDDNGNSDLRGMLVHERGIVRLTREGEVRWTTWSIFSGVERWRSESVQVGGVKSAKGVLGNWFDKDYDPRGPAGPTAFWKLSDRTTRVGDNLPLHDFIPMMNMTVAGHWRGSSDEEDEEEAVDGEGEGEDGEDGDEESENADFVPIIFED